jgi:hypothetical protein
MSEAVTALIRRTLLDNSVEVVTALQVLDYGPVKIVTNLFADGPHDVSGQSDTLEESMQLHESLVTGVASDGLDIKYDRIVFANCPQCHGEASLARRTRYYSYRLQYPNGVNGQSLIGEEDSEDVMDHDSPVDAGFACTKCNYVSGLQHTRFLNEAQDVVFTDLTEVKS